MLSTSRLDEATNSMPAKTNKQLEHAIANLTKEDHKCQHQEARDEYTRAIRDLNLLQSNSRVIALAKYKSPAEILPLFRRQLECAGIKVSDLDQLKIIHVSGTKGKGSTCAFTESILRQSGLKTGMYNSPHLIKVTERIRIGGKPMSELEFSKHFRLVFDRMLRETELAKVPMPSYFSFLTILAFHIFLAERVDCVIMEVGIGGEYDPTNVIERPVACGITTLDFDHTNILGDTIERIAWSKAGIAKPGAPLFTVDHEQQEAMEVIKGRAKERASPLVVCREIAGIRSLKLGISGAVQYVNASLACRMATYLLSSRATTQTLEPAMALEEEIGEIPGSFRVALASCTWPGRCQLVNYVRCRFFIDGAHTKKSMQNCLAWFLQESHATTEADPFRILMINVIGERDKREVLRPLAECNHFDLVIFSTNRINPAGDTPKSETFVNIQGPSSERSLENVRLNESIWNDLKLETGGRRPEVLLAANTFDAIKTITGIAHERRCHILATGSLHFVGAVLETLPMVDELKR